MLVGGKKNLEDSLADYNLAWEELRIDAQATTISWKVADKDSLFKNLVIIKDKTEQVHIGTVNDRFIASAALKKPMYGMGIIKILERRPGSDDALGLDSIDYLVDDIEETYESLKGVGAVKESNDMHEWLSLRFGENKQFEAKFTDHLVLEVAIKELEIASNQIRKSLK